MSSYTELEDAALHAESAGNWRHAAHLWRQAGSVAIGECMRKRCALFEAEARAHAQRVDSRKVAA